ncbi:hypothetical protein PINS_up016542 [Pythium insidiosum]|nr:hypothetical protein PINS_up016542 [Pythium insidiosum]
MTPRTTPRVPSASTPPPDDDVLCYISPRAFRVTWWVIICIYVLVCLQMAAYAGFYVLISGIPSVDYYSTLFRLISMSQFPIVTATYAIGALLFLYQIFRLISLSLRHRRLCLIDETATSRVVVHTPQIVSIGGHTKAGDFTSRPPHRHAVVEFKQALTRVFSVKGPYFEFVMLTRELIEIVVQILQAYASSQYTPNVWLNYCYGALIVTNCVSTPLLHKLGHRSADLGHRRLAILVADLVLDGVWFVLPLLLFPYYLSNFFGGEAVMYQDTFMVRALMETQLIFVASHLDLLFKVMPAIGLFLTTRKMRNLLRRAPSPTNTKPAIQAKDNQGQTGATATDKANDGPTLAAIGVHHRSYLPRLVRYRLLAERMMEALLLMLGVFALVMYLLVVALPGTCASGCKLVLHPWLVYSRCRCAVQEINCHERGIIGSMPELQAALANLEHQGLQSLIFTHCRMLEMPPEIRRFSDLYGLEIYNSTVATWPMDAAITQDAYYQLGYLYLIRTAIPSVPDALLIGDLPSTLVEIDFIVSNITTLPHDLDVRWPHIRTLYFDHSHLAKVPPVLGRMPHLQSLSLYDNGIAEIPDDVFAPSALSYLLLNGNPIRSLPQALGRLGKLYEIQVQFTNISSLDGVIAWMAAHKTELPASFRLYARGSPLCLQDKSVLAAAPLTISCGVRESTYSGQRSLAYYALEGKTLERRIE